MVSTEINPHIYRQMSFNMSVKIIHWGKDSLFNKWCWGNYGPFFPPSNVPSGHHKKKQWPEFQQLLWDFENDIYYPRITEQKERFLVV